MYCQTLFVARVFKRPTQMDPQVDPKSSEKSVPMGSWTRLAVPSAPQQRQESTQDAPRGARKAQKSADSEICPQNPPQFLRANFRVRAESAQKCVPGRHFQAQVRATAAPQDPSEIDPKHSFIFDLLLTFFLLFLVRKIKSETFQNQ